MNHKKNYAGIWAALGMLFLILDSATALDGAREGIEMCIRTVIPSLFPFFVLSNLVTGSLAGRKLAFLAPLERLMRIPRGSGPLFLSGLLGGYPVGAQGIELALQRGQLSPAAAERMIVFCNNAGPAFLFGMAASLFPRLWMAWALWGVQILSAVLTGMLLPGGTSEAMETKAKQPATLPGAVQASLRAMATVCAWVVLFRILLAFLERWFLWILPVPAAVGISGILELANGCCELASLEGTGQRFTLCAGFLAFGGICVMLQIRSVAQETGLRLYFPGKGLQTAISILMALLLQPLFSDGMGNALLVPAAAIISGLTISLTFLKKRKKGVEIHSMLVYNKANTKI